MDFRLLKKLYQAGSLSIEKVDEEFEITITKYDRDTGEVTKVVKQRFGMDEVDNQILEAQSELDFLNNVKTQLQAL